MHIKNITQRGRVERLIIRSRALEGNAMGDPIERDVGVYLPYGFDSSRHYPLLVEYAGYANSGMGRLSWKGFGENVPERLDRLIQEGMPPAVVVFPDCFTRLGGNQYINTYLGRYADFIREDVVPVVEQKFSCGGDGNRACYGKSSGGYGALVHGMLYSDFWSGIGCLSGDMGFEMLFAPIMARALIILNQYENSIESFLQNFEHNPNPKWSEIECLGFLCAAASFDPDPTCYLGIRLPLDPYTAERTPERWKNWLGYDPLVMVDRYESALNKLKLVYFDCGNRDQFNLQFGARRLHQILKQKGIQHSFEEFPGDHQNLDYRLDPCLQKLISVLNH